jgi:hypothetical protein
MHKNGNEQVNILETERLWLRHLRADDADFMVELLNEPAFRQNVGDRGVRNTALPGQLRATSNSVLACTWWR